MEGREQLRVLEVLAGFYDRVIDSLPLIFAACIDSGWGGFILGRESIAR